MSDVFDRNVVLFVFFVVFLYLKFLEVKTSTKTTWNNKKCNPLNLFSDSLFQTQEESNKDFERCIVNLSASTTTALFSKEKTEQEAVLLEMSGITNSYTSLTDEIGDYIEDISNTKAEFESQIKAVQTSQGQANDLNNTTTGFVNQYISNIQTIFNNITSYFQK